MKYIGYLEQEFKTKVRKIKKIPVGWLTYDYTDACGFEIWHSHKSGSRMRYAAHRDVNGIWSFYSFRFPHVL